MVPLIKSKRLLIHVSVFLLSCLLFPVFEAASAQSEEKIAIGAVEEVMLLPWRVKIPARIDTGATTSSLDARELTTKDNMASFKLPAQYGGIELQLPIVSWKNIRSADARERRPVVELDICLGSRLVRALVNLNDRSRMKYPLIIGRNVLKENFIIDCEQERCTTPSCPGIPVK